ncbi:MAG TPA: efflux RND transporter periplasmic adaptor subunit [Holophaga sp.]|nr:efflux RND transporter periplasmic adaptor subunit [Holophaga sp.]HPS67028.1 efflux RND transporter periplasmic adaptor subunit [Holophaga sp.]
MKKRSRILWIAGLALVALAGAWAAVSHFRESPDAFSWDLVDRGEIRETLSASGEIQARTRINIGTSVTGEIKALPVKDGQDVKAGDVLVVIDRERLRQETSQAEASLEASRKEAARLGAARDRARENTARIESLFRQGLVSDEDFRQAKLGRESAELNFEAARANVARDAASAAAMRDSYGKTVIKAPIDGRVTSLKAEVGETAIPGTSNLPGATLMVISDMSEIIAEIQVNESEVVRLRNGHPAQVVVEALPGRVFPGKVYEIASAAEQSGDNANMYKVKVALAMSSPDIGRLRPGMSARAVVLTDEKARVLRVPLQAVLDREGSVEEARRKGLLSPEARSVVMVARGRRVEERTLSLGIADNQNYEVKGGLSAGDRVLTGPIRKLKELKAGDSVTMRRKSDKDLEEDAKRKEGRQP